MAFFQNILKSIKSAFGGTDNERVENGIAKERSVLSNYTTNSTPTTTTSIETPISEAAPAEPVAGTPVTAKPSLATIASTPKVKQTTEVSDIVEYQVQSAPSATHLDILVDSLNLNKNKFVIDRGVVTIPFDASGCDFDTKCQLSMALATEYDVLTDILPSGIACTELSKRIFRCLKASQEECFVCGCLFIAVTQDIDSDGYLVAEVTNTHNGNSVFFDIPASITPLGSIDIDYDLITTNIMISRERVA